MFPEKTKQLQTHKHTHAHTCNLLSSAFTNLSGGACLRTSPFSRARGGRPAAAFSDEYATRRPLTSLEEKIKVCERPDRLGSATNPEMSELGLPGLESSMNEKLWNEWKQGLDLPKKKKKTTTHVQTAVEKQTLRVCRVSVVPSPIMTDQ